MQNFLQKLHKIYQYWQDQWSDENQSLKSFLIRIFSILSLYIILDRTLMLITTLPHENYYEPFIFFAFIKYIFTNWYLIFFIILALIFIFQRNNLFSTWKNFPKGNYIRFLILVSGGILTWIFTTYNYNLFFNQAHYFDRFLLFAFLILIYWRPVFVFPFLIILLPIIWQFTVLPVFTYSVFFIPIRLLILFGSFFLIYLFIKKFPLADFVFLCCCLIVIHYWSPGIDKVRYNWILYDQIYFLLPTTYANGWLGFLKAETISSLTQNLSLFNFPLKILTIILEVGSMFFFLHRHLSKFFLGGWIMLHLGIFLVSGIFFWLWILIDLAFLILFIKKDGFSTLPIFTKKHLLVSLLLIITGNFWCKPASLAWFDSPVTYTYRFEAETIDGKTHDLPPIFFAPFEYQFTLGYFGYLDKKPLIPVVWGATDSDFGLKLINVDSDQQLLILEKESGKIRFNKEAKLYFEQFLKTYIKNWNKRLSNKTTLSFIKAPRYIQTYPISVNIQKPIKKVQIFQVLSVYRNGKYSEPRKEIINTVEID